jgi:hypothetical protein
VSEYDVTIEIEASVVSTGANESGQSVDAAGPVVLVRGRNSIANISGAVLVCTLPPSPSDGDRVRVRDAYRGKLGAAGASTHAFHIYPDDPDAQGFEDGSAAYLVIDVDGGSFELVFNADRSIWEEWS